MKLVAFTCPGCGAQLNVNVDLKQATCPYCSKTFPVDDETQYVKLDGAAQVGYEFEKGRQQAQAEFEQYKPQQAYANAQAEPHKKRKTWLWVLGWIFIFPVPLTILMLKNERLNKEVRYGVIAAAWIVYLLISLVSGGSSKSNKNMDTSSSGTTVAAVQSTSSSAETTTTSNMSVTGARQMEGIIGEPIQVITKNGELEITVDGFELSDEMRKRYTYSDADVVKEGKTIGLLLLKVRNISYNDEYNEGYVSLEPEVHPIDADGVSLDAMSSSYDYSEYSGAAGAFFPCEIGQTKRVALFYVVYQDLANINIQVGDTIVPVDL